MGSDWLKNTIRGIVLSVADTLTGTHDPSATTGVTGETFDTDKRGIHVILAGLASGGPGGALNGTPAQGTLSATTTAAIANNQGNGLHAENLTNRKLIVIVPRDGDVRWGVSTSVSDTIGGLVAQDIPLALSIGPDVDLYLAATSGTVVVDIAELA